MSAVPVHQLRHLCDVYDLVGVISLAFNFDGTTRLVVSPSCYADKRTVRDQITKLGQELAKQVQPGMDDEFLESTGAIISNEVRAEDFQGNAIPSSRFYVCNTECRTTHRGHCDDDEVALDAAATVERMKRIMEECAGRHGFKAMMTVTLETQKPMKPGWQVEEVYKVIGARS